jgi:hypothetical protein
MLRFGSRVELSRGVLTRDGYPLWFKLLLSLALGYLFISIHVLTGTYQNWLSEYRPWYTPTFHLSVSFVVALVLLLEHLSNLSSIQSSKRKWAILLVVATVVSGVIAVNTLSTLAVRDALKNRNIVWHLMYQLKSSDIPSEIERGETILFKELPDARKLERSEIFSAFINKVVKVYPDSTNAVEDYDWVIRVRYGYDAEDAFMLIGRPESSIGGVDLFRGVWVIPYTGVGIKDAFVERNSKCYLPLTETRKNKRGIWITGKEYFSMNEVVLMLKNHQKQPVCQLE